MPLKWTNEIPASDARSVNHSDERDEPDAPPSATGGLDSHAAIPIETAIAAVDQIRIAEVCNRWN
jgi:hypothetical protein